MANNKPRPGNDAYDPSGVNYVPSGNNKFLLKIRNSLSQFSDIFSEFNKFISPAYHHDRCERYYMRLYSMNKSEFAMVFLGFFVCFSLGIVIGLSGPPITSTTEINADKLLQNTTDKTKLLATGPFVIKSPFFSTYSQQLWLIGKLETNNHDDEKYDKSFHVSVGIDGLTENHKEINILDENNVKNRTRHLLCEKNLCEEFTILHLGFLEYAHYMITIKFYDLESFHQKYNIKQITFYFKTYSPAFSQIEIWFRFIFLLFTFIVTCWFAHTLRKYDWKFDWSIEQKWMSVLLPLLMLYNNPLFPIIFISNSWFFGMTDAIFQATFLCALLLFWLCIYHGLRQNERKFIKFYLPKLIVVLPIWLCAIVLATWEKCNELRDPTYSHFVDTKNYHGFKIFFYVAGVMYILYLLLLVLRAYSELRSMPYFDMRLKFLTLLMLFVITISLIVAANRFGFGILEDNFVANLNTTYKSSAQFMCFYGLLNFYLYTMAYVYSPNGKPIPQEITKDNPAFSMINDSDEEVVYGSEDESRRPLNSTNGKNDYDSD